MGAIGPLAGAGRPRRREGKRPIPRRIASFLIWWTLLMALWVWADDTLLAAELIVGAVVAAFAAGLVELAQHQSESHIRIRSDWVAPAVKIPLKIARDTGVVFVALLRQVLTGRGPASRFEEQPVRAGGDSYQEVSRRALIIGGSSAAPNEFALGIDNERDVMVVHQLVPKERKDD